MLDKVRFITYEQNRNEETLYKWLQLPDKEKGKVLTRPIDLFDNSYIKKLTLDELNNFNFKTPKIVLFYAEWCHYCQEISVPYKNVAKKLYEQDRNITLYAFNVPLYIDSMSKDDQKEFNKKYSIPGYPYLVSLTGKSTRIEFNKERTEQTILNWVKSQLSTTTPSMLGYYRKRNNKRNYSGKKEEKQILNIKDINDTFTEEKDKIKSNSPLSFTSVTENGDIITMSPLTNKRVSSIVMVYADWCGHCVATKPHYLKVVELFPNVQFYLINADDKTAILKKRYNIKGFPTIFHIDVYGNSTYYKGLRNVDEIKEWVEELTK
jgi:thiol-disulfide isomerase/thioredoxin